VLIDDPVTLLAKDHVLKTELESDGKNTKNFKLVMLVFPADEFKKLYFASMICRKIFRRDCQSSSS